MTDTNNSFWKVLRNSLKVRSLLAVFIMLFAFEVVSRLAPSIIGKQIHQKYLYNKRICQQDCTNKDKLITWQANGRGARGDIYNAQLVQIAVLGTSTSIDSLLDQKQCYSQQLKNKLGPNKVHVDNFARDGSGMTQAITILEHFTEKGSKYDAVLIMEHFDIEDEDLQTSTFHYWGQWVVDKEMFKFPTLLRKRIKQQVKTEPRLNRIDRWVHDKLLKPDKPADPGRNERRMIRQSPAVKLVDIPINISDNRTRLIRQKTQQLIKAAKKVTDRVYVISQPYAYDHSQLPGVADKWFALRKVNDTEDLYYSNKSIAEFGRAQNSMIEQAARSADAGIIDLDGFMRKFLCKRDDLFDDKWHFAPAGADLAAEFVAEKIRDDISD
jgi:hypothetical protein